MRTSRLGVVPLFILVGLLFILPARGQELRVISGLRVSKGLGYANPDFVAGLAPEYQSKRFLFRGEALYRSAHKLETADGYAYTARAEFYSKFSRFYAGGGLNYSRTITSLWSKASVRPLVAGGVEGRLEGKYPMRLFGYYIFKGSDERNGLQGPGLRLEIDVKPKVRITAFELDVYRFYPTDQPTLGAKTGFRYGASVSYVLAGRKQE